MARSFHQNYVHIVFSTKDRRPLITAEFEERLYSYLGGIVREMSGSLIKGNGTADHVHLLVKSSKSVSDAEFMRILKANSSKWVKSIGATTRNFAWQEGYGWFSVSRSNLGTVERYIERQKEHHRERSFKEEFVKLLEAHEVEYDERFVWS